MEVPGWSLVISRLGVTPASPVPRRAVHGGSLAIYQLEPNPIRTPIMMSEVLSYVVYKIQ